MFESLSRITRLTETVQVTADHAGLHLRLRARLFEVRRHGQLTATYHYDTTVNGNRTRLTTESRVTIGAYNAQDRLTDYLLLRGACAESW